MRNNRTGLCNVRQLGDIDNDFHSVLKYSHFNTFGQNTWKITTQENQVS